MSAQDSVIQRESLRDKILEVLKTWILDGTLQPGEKIVEATIARKLRVSRGPLREALFVLSQRGFVEIRPNHGARVTRLSNRDIEEIFEIRELLEVRAAMLVAAAMSSEKKERMEASLENLRRAAESRDIVRFNEADFAFHRTLWELSGNHHIVKVLVNLTTRFFGYEQIRDMPNSPRFHYQEVFEDHRRMLDLVLEGDPHKIAEGFSKSFQVFRDYVIARFGQADRNARLIKSQTTGS